MPALTDDPPEGATEDATEVATSADRARYIAAARAKYADRSDDDVEVDEDARVAIGEDGAWVQAWMFLRHPVEEIDPTPYCSRCLAKRRASCRCGPILPDD